LVIDEDVPGGCAAYLLNEIIEKQGAYQFLDSAPQTLTAKAHRPAYGSDGDYFSKPNAEDIFEKGEQTGLRYLFCTQISLSLSFICTDE